MRHKIKKVPVILSAPLLVDGCSTSNRDTDRTAKLATEPISSKAVPEPQTAPQGTVLVNNLDKELIVPLRLSDNDDGSEHDRATIAEIKTELVPALPSTESYPDWSSSANAVQRIRCLSWLCPPQALTSGGNARSIRCSDC
jgi:hypothetical protein